MNIKMERVGAGVLVTMGTTTISFETVAEALEFGHALIQVCFLGADVLDHAHEELGT